MGPITRAWFLALLMTLTASSFADRVVAQEPVIDPVNCFSSGYFWNRRANAVVTPESGGIKWRIDFPDYQSAIGRFVTTPMNWSNYDYITMVVTNRDPNNSIRINLVVQISADPNNYSGALNTPFYIGAGETKRLMFPLRTFNPRDYGLRRLPPVLSDPFSWVAVSGSYNLSTVYHWRLSYQQIFAGSIDVTDFRMLKYDTSMNLLSDRFGQYTDRDWTNKVQSEADFPGLVAAEAADLAANPPNGDTFGSLRLRREAVSSSWKMVKRDGKWYMVHPTGKLFWSLGLNGVSSIASTVVEGRSSMFEYLPPQNGPLADLYETRATNNGDKLTYNFYRQNLRTKFGTSSTAPFEDLTRQRLKSWGFNTIGSWSHQNFYDGSIPFTMFTSTSDFPTRLRCPYVHVNDLPDPFDPGFGPFLADRFQTLFRPHVNKRNFMGVMVDNEMSWGWGTTNALRYNMALGAMTSSVYQPARVEFRRQLRVKYSTIEAVNAAWGSSYSSWSDFATATSFTPSYTPGQIADFQTFCRSVAAAYYGKVRSALNGIGFKGLYLGSRFYPYTPEVLQGAAKYVHAFTINVYGQSHEIDWPTLNTFPKPVVLSEFSFGLQSGGTLGGPAEVNTPTARRQSIVDFMTAALFQPNIVGVHWFEYVDHPVTGRFSDGENYGIGLVDMTDTPNADVVGAFRQSTATMYQVRRGY